MNAWFRPLALAGLVALPGFAIAQPNRVERPSPANHERHDERRADPPGRFRRPIPPPPPPAPLALRFAPSGWSEQLRYTQWLTLPEARRELCVVTTFEQRLDPRYGGIGLTARPVRIEIYGDGRLYADLAYLPRDLGVLDATIRPGAERAQVSRSIRLAGNPSVGFTLYAVDGWGRATAAWQVDGRAGRLIPVSAGWRQSPGVPLMADDLIWLHALPAWGERNLVAGGARVDLDRSGDRMRVRYDDGQLRYNGRLTVSGSNGRFAGLSGFFDADHPAGKLRRDIELTPLGFVVRRTDAPGRDPWGQPMLRGQQLPPTGDAQIAPSPDASAPDAPSPTAPPGSSRRLTAGSTATQNGVRPNRPRPPVFDDLAIDLLALRLSNDGGGSVHGFRRGRRPAPQAHHERRAIVLPFAVVFLVVS